MSGTSRLTLILGATALFSTGAYAATDPADAEAGTADPRPATEEIVVTAQRREERLSDVPIAVTAIGGDQLVKNVILSTTDLTATVPGLIWGRSTNFSQVTIRGIGTRNITVGDEPNVATYIDGIYIPSADASLMDLANIERIEVLRGPQGTLFGRNATGGAVSLVTKAPSWTPTASVSATAGEFGYYRLAATASGPIVDDVLAVSVSALASGDQGYVRNIYTNEMQGTFSARVATGRLLWKAAPTLTFQLNGSVSESRNNVLVSLFALGGNTQVRNSIPGGTTAAIFNPTNIPANRLIADTPFTTATPYSTSPVTRQWFLDGRADWDLGFATLSGHVTRGRVSTNNLSWSETSPLKLSQTEYYNRTLYWNEDLTLTSNTGPDSAVTWLVGVTGFQSKAFQNQTLTPRSATTGAPAPVATYYGQYTDAVAAFGEVTWQALDHLYLTGGLRYTSEKRRSYNRAIATGVVTQRSATFNNASPRAVVRYEFAPDSSIYASYTKGFKSGVFNAGTAAGAALPVRPELVDAYEIGTKARLFPGLSAEISAFTYDYRDLQVSSTVTVNGASTTAVQNAGTAKIKGLEATLKATVLEGLVLNGTMALLDTDIRNFPNATVQVPRVNTAGVPTLNGNLTVSRDVSGNELIRAPHATFSVGATYTHEFASKRLIVNGSAFFSDAYFLDLTNRLRQPRYEIVNGSITMESKSGSGFFGSVFVQNLTNEKHLVGYLLTAFGDYGQMNKPRWFGATVGYRY